MQSDPAVEFVWQRKDQMVVMYGQKLRLLPLGPLVGGSALALGTVPISAAVIPALLAVAFIALEQLPTQGGRATCLQMTAHLTSTWVQVRRIGKAFQDRLHRYRFAHDEPAIRSAWLTSPCW